MLFFVVLCTWKLNFRLQCVFRYKAGQRFGRHIDESNDLGDGKRTHYTLLIYLSGGGFKPKAKSDTSSLKDSSSEPLVGGETVFYGSRNSVVAEVSYVFVMYHIAFILYYSVSFLCST